MHILGDTACPFYSELLFGQRDEEESVDGNTAVHLP